MARLHNDVARVKEDSPNETVTVFCPATNNPIYDMDKNNNTYYHASHGTCTRTGMDFHIDALEMPENVASQNYPVRYFGYHSKNWQNYIN